MTALDKRLRTQGFYADEGRPSMPPGPGGDTKSIDATLAAAHDRLADVPEPLDDETSAQVSKRVQEVVADKSG